MSVENLENKIGFQIGFLIHSGKSVEATIEDLKKIAIDYHKKNSELSNLLAIREYLMKKGANDESLNDRIKELTK